MSLKTNCPLCDTPNPQPVFDLKNVPVICNQLWPDAVAAKAAPAGDVDLTICPTCSLVWNSAFDPERMVYAPGYENALHFSPKFQAFAKELAAGLVERHNLKGKHVFEIGCGDGHMLELMSKHGVATATGFDPSMDGVASEFTKRDGVEIVPEYFRSDQLDRPFDAIMCRHVLEHIDAPMPLLTDIRRAIGDRNVPVYFEMPNAGWMLDAVSMWDVIYEHVTYWASPAMTTLFKRTGFEPVAITAGYGGQFLMIEARPTKPKLDYVSKNTGTTKASAEAFTKATTVELSKWRKRLSAMDGKAVIWGAGSKGITFANSMGEAGKPLAALVDLNPRKHGLFAPGVALPVVAPEALKDIKPDLVLISNALYKGEITAQVRSMGLDAEIGVIAG